MSIFAAVPAAGSGARRELSWGVAKAVALGAPSTEHSNGDVRNLDPKEQARPSRVIDQRRVQRPTFAPQLDRDGFPEAELGSDLCRKIVRRREFVADEVVRERRGDRAMGRDMDMYKTRLKD